MSAWPPSDESRLLTRRQALTLAGGAATLSLLGCSQPKAPTGLTFGQWQANRGRTYLIAHRGSGDVLPEHSLEAYEAALDWGAKALEISVVGTSDGVLICQHDLTFDRTTNLKGRVAEQPSSVLLEGRIDIPRLGPRWQGERRPRIAKLDEVLGRIGKRAVLFIEAKDDAVYPSMMRLVEEHGLMASTAVKVHYPSRRIEMAHEAGYPVFAYFGSADELTAANVDALVARLKPSTDVIVIPSSDDSGPLSDATIKRVTKAGIPVWVFPVHRRWELDYYFQRGVVGAMASSYGYLSRAVQPMRQTDWASGGLSPGEMTRIPDMDSFGLSWPDPGVIALSSQGRQAFLTLGQLCPLEHPAGPYRVQLKIRVDTPPGDEASNFSLAFAHDDDRYYEHRQGTLNGYHAIMRMDGKLEFRIHRAGEESGEEIGKSQPGPAPKKGSWIPLQLDVDTTSMSWQRLDTGQLIQTEHSQFRGGYLHIGRSADDGVISVKDVVVS